MGLWRLALRERITLMRTGWKGGSLAPFGPNAARHVRRADRFEHVADVMVNSTYYAEMDEVAAFEELVGSHGGMGGSQSFPFVVLPAGWRLPEQSIVGPDNMHRHMRRWLADLGHERRDAPPGAVVAVSGKERADPARRARITWLGHSTVLVELDGTRLP